MKKLLVIVLGIMINIFLVFAHEEPAKTLKEKLEKEKSRIEIIENEITSLTVWKYEILDNKPDLISKEKFLTTLYDTSGNISEMHFFKADDTLDYKVIFGYDENNNMITDTDYNPDGTIAQRIEYMYDENGRVKEQINYLSSGAIDSKFTYDIDKDGDILLFNKYKPLDSIEYQIIYKYNGSVDNGNNIEIVKQKPDGDLLLRVENIFNDENQRVQKRIFDENNRLLYYFEYSYFDHSNRFSSITKLSSENLPISETIYTLNEYGFIETVKTMDNFGGILSFSRYEYNISR
jgi:YD repeat-containing protein